MFYEWLMTQADRDDPIGDLANDAQRDPKAPTSGEECLLAEIQENMSRNELTGAERKAFAAEVGRLITVLSENSQNIDDSQRESDWFREWREKSGIGQNTAYTWWASFCKEAGLKLTPKQADMALTRCLWRLGAAT